MSLPITEGALLRRFIETLPLGVAVLDVDLRFVQVNQHLAELNARPIDEHPGRSLDEALSPALVKLVPLLRSVREKGVPLVDEEIAGEMPVGSGMRTWLLSAHPLREGEALIGLLCLVQEVTEQRRAQEALRKSERLFRTLTHHAPVGIFLTDTQGRCQFVNERWQELAGIPLADALGEGWARALHPEDRERVYQEWRRATTTGEVFSAEYRFRTPEGKVSWLQGYGGSLYDEGRLLGYLGTVTDITARREADELRRQMFDLNERLVGMVSHDLRSPLSTIRLTATNLLQSKEVPAIVGERAAMIIRNVERMARMINELLDLTRARLGGGIPITRNEMDLAALCEEVASEVKIAHPGHDISCQKAGALVGAFDRDRLHEVISNLVENAVQYGAPPIRLWARGAQNEVILEVSNRGRPIPEEQLRSIFEPFRRGAMPGQTRREGLGLGLYISREIVAAHGGTLSVRSTEAEGTTFTVRMPRARETTDLRG